MIFGKTKLEMKVGIFVFIGLIILVVFVLSIGGVKTWSSGYKVNFIFNFVNGVKNGAPVRFAGVDSGVVRRIKFFHGPKDLKNKVRVTCWVHKSVSIPLDSKIWVNTLGLLGEKYIEIMPGEEADFNENKISVQSPVGTGLLNHKKGDLVEIQVPRGILKYKILKISR